MYVELYVTDTYDFNKGEKSGAPAVGRDAKQKQRNSVLQLVHAAAFIMMQTALKKLSRKFYDFTSEFSHLTKVLNF